MFASGTSFYLCNDQVNYFHKQWPAVKIQLFAMNDPAHILASLDALGNLKTQFYYFKLKINLDFK